ncbi:MAG: hypothetical protein JRJ31_18405, partial [Deltaproteobacteria bacterium]|nr:hypothetical protein [Deltaproteobacteria bacterium]
IRRIATEFIEQARIGSTIKIQGVTLPYRPAAVVQFRGAEGHSNGFHTFMAIDMLNQLAGSSEVPGGTIGWAVRCLGHPETGNPHFSPYVSKDGFIASSAWTAGLPGVWPHAKPKWPKRAHLRDLFTAVTSAAAGLVRNAEETWEMFGIEPYEMGFVQYCNPLMTGANSEVQEKRMKRMFIVALAVVPTETTEAVADIILPDVSPLELTDAIEADQCYHFNYPMGMMDWEFHPHIAVVEPTHERRFIGEVYLGLLHRLGLTKDANQTIIGMLSKVGDPPPIDPEEKLTSWQDLSDRLLKTRFGPERGLEWFKEHGFIRWPKKVEEVYWRPHVKARSSIYNEWLLEYKDKVKNICDKAGFSLDWDQYTPPVTFFPSIINKKEDEQFDMIAFGYRDILHNASGTQEFPWLLEASERNPFTFNACINAQTAKKKGIQDKDMIYIENRIGQRIKTRAHTVQGIHPEVIAMTHGSGHWLDGHPAKGKGGLLNNILEVDWDHFDPVCQNIETAARVRLYKADD